MNIRLLFVLIAFTGVAAAQPADTILVNGKVLLGDDQFNVRQALAVKEGRILAVGTNSEIRKLAGKVTAS